MLAFVQVTFREHSVPTSSIAHSAAHTGPLPKSMHDEFATQSVGDWHALPTDELPA